MTSLRPDQQRDNRLCKQGLNGEIGPSIFMDTCDFVQSTVCADKSRHLRIFFDATKLSAWDLPVNLI